jgi:hypothetical protein
LYGPEQVRIAEVADPGGELVRGRDEILVVAAAVCLEPVALVVRLELLQELER